MAEFKQKDIEFFKAKDCLFVQNLLKNDEIGYYIKLCYAFLNKAIEASKFRSDLSGEDEKEVITN